MVCKKCGNEFNGNFCTACGTGVNCENPFINNNDKGKNQKKKKDKGKLSKKKKIIISLCSVFGVLLIGFVVLLLFHFGVFGKTASNAPDEFLEADVIGYVTSSFTDITNEDDSFDAKKSKVNNHLTSLQNNGYIKNIQYSEVDKMFRFEYKTGRIGYYSFEKPSDEEWSVSSSGNNKTDVFPVISPVAKSSSSSQNLDSKWLFMFYSNSTHDSENYKFISGQADVYRSAGIDVDLVTDYTVEDFLDLDGYDLIYVMGHGVQYSGSNETYIGLSEVVTTDGVEKYREMGLLEKGDEGDIGTISYENDPNSYYVLSPSFFDSNYEDEKLDDSVMLLTLCSLFGSDDQRDDDFGKSFVNAGASTVVGFLNSVSQSYSKVFLDEILLSLLEGDSVSVAFNEAKNHLGANEIAFYDKLGTIHNNTATPVIYGKGTKTLLSETSEKPYPYGEYVINVKDSLDNTNVDGAVFTFVKGTIEDYSTFYVGFTNSNGTGTVVAPEGKYVCIITHDLYQDKYVNVVVDNDTVSVMLDDVFLDRKTGSLQLTVTDSQTGVGIPGVKVSADFTEKDDNKYDKSAVSDANGIVKIDLMYGSYSLEFTHEDYEYYGCSLKIDTETVVMLEPIELKKKTNVDKIIGTYKGSYFASQGETGLTLSVYKENDKLKALFDFYNLPGKSNAESGKYYMDVTYDASTQEYIFTSTQWISKPTTYIFVDLRGTLIDDVLSGFSPTRFSLIKTDSSQPVIIPQTTPKPTNIPEDALEFNGSYYKVYNDSISWDEAKEKCEEMGGHLLTITSQEEQFFVTGIISQQTNNCYWLGATNSADGSTWKWVTGEAFDYTNWKSGEPNNENYSENYLEIFAKTYDDISVGQWNDIMIDGRNGKLSKEFYSSSSVGYICEWN